MQGRSSPHRIGSTHQFLLGCACTMILVTFSRNTCEAFLLPVGTSTPSWTSRNLLLPNSFNFHFSSRTVRRGRGRRVFWPEVAPTMKNQNSQDDDKEDSNPEDGDGRVVEETSNIKQQQQEQPIVETTMKIDDHGSDLSNRFKYKMHALMGSFDPQTGEDDERQDGNILNAILEFPVRYTFNVVGKTGGDDELQVAYVDTVKNVVAEISDAGGGDDDIVCQVIPRGKNFIKVQCEVEVQSAGMINLIYDEIAKIDNTVMKF